MRHNISNSHKHRKDCGTVDEDYEVITPEIDKVNFMFNDTIKDCVNKHFHSFEYRYVYNITFIKTENNEDVF